MLSLPQTLGFPPPFFGDKAHRLQVISQGTDWFLMEKPVDTVSDAHPWHPKQMSLTEALRSQAAHKKPELEALWDQEVRSIFTLDAEMSGAIGFSVGEGATAHWRDQFGSNLLKFTFLFLALEVKPMEGDLTCDLPILVDPKTAQSKVSHRYGKKAVTHFKRLANRPLPPSLQKKWGSQFKTPEGLSLGLWEAETDYLRAHQIRLHASELGLLILGESSYTPFPLEISLRDLLPKARKGETSTNLYPHLALHLSRLEGLHEAPIEVPLPKALKIFINRLEMIQS